MAEVEEPKFNSLADRIAALNSQKNFTSPPPVAGKRAPPPPPPAKHDTSATRTATTSPPSLPARTNTASSLASVKSTPPTLPTRGSTPALPSRKSTTQVPPSLPSRTNTSGDLSVSRRESNSSLASHVSTVSGTSLRPVSSQTSATSVETQPSRRVLAPTLDQSKLPALPPSRKEREARELQEAEKAKAESQSAKISKPPVLPSRSTPAVPQARPPPRTPSRPVRSVEPAQQEEAVSNSGAARRLPPAPSAFVRPQSTQSAAPKVPSSRPAKADPPPVPVSSRPSFAEIEAFNTRAAAGHCNQAVTETCLICRDFSAQDRVAAQYPAHTLPRDDPIGYLAQVLAGPFPSATDKARAIFTWFHHNIAYNVEEFFGGCIKGRSPEETIFLGKAVCQGYAETYMAIAKRAGLQCVLVSGQARIVGSTEPKKGDPVPPRPPNANHAWNAVCIDNGEWKLIDACWGAGAVDGNDQRYIKRFADEMFTLENHYFGLKHLPDDPGYLLRMDRRVISWEEYIMGPLQGVKQAQWYGNGTVEGLSEFTFEPRARHIPVYSGEVVRFQFSKRCEHWIHEKHGPGKVRLLMIKIHGVDGRKDDLVPLDTDGSWWWADIPARDLGAPGEKIHLYAVKTLNNKDARGLTKSEYYRTKSGGGYSESWDIYAEWELV